MALHRMFFNQPSTLQPDHHLHGVNVLVDLSRDRPVARVYFLEGPVVSGEYSRLSLSHGWIAEAARPVDVHPG